MLNYAVAITISFSLTIVRSLSFSRSLCRSLSRSRLHSRSLFLLAHQTMHTQNHFRRPLLCSHIWASHKFTTQMNTENKCECWTDGKNRLRWLLALSAHKAYIEKHVTRWSWTVFSHFKSLSPHISSIGGSSQRSEFQWNHFAHRSISINDAYLLWWIFNNVSMWLFSFFCNRSDLCLLKTKHIDIFIISSNSSLSIQLEIQMIYEFKSNDFSQSISIITAYFQCTFFWLWNVNVFFKKN